LPSHDPSCYLCPGNVRAHGDRNPPYEGPFVFANDFPALVPGDDLTPPGTDLFFSQPVFGECRVMCFSPLHNVTLATMDGVGVEAVIRAWQSQLVELGERWTWVQLFENHGSAMGASNPHPHCQIWTTDFVPTIPLREALQQHKLSQELGVPLLLNYLREELARKDRVVIESEHWAWLVPFWAEWPFEILLLPKRHVRWLPGLTEHEVEDLARVLKAGLTGYDRLFGIDFPYSMGWDSVPRSIPEHDSGNLFDSWQLHAHFYPPLLRSATVRKFMVGFEMLGEAQRDITPEEAAERLRNVTPGL